MNKIDTRSEIRSLPLDRRAFLAASGALVVTLAARSELAQAAAPYGAATRPPRLRQLRFRVSKIVRMSSSV